MLVVKQFFTKTCYLKPKPEFKFLFVKKANIVKKYTLIYIYIYFRKTIVCIPDSPTLNVSITYYHT